MANYIAKLDESRDAHLNVVRKSFAQAHKLAQNKKGNILLMVPMLQNLEHGNLSDALGESIAKQIKKGDVTIEGVRCSRISLQRNPPTYLEQSTVILMLWATVIDVESISKKFNGKTDIVVCEWIADELRRWEKDYKAIKI